MPAAAIAGAAVVGAGASVYSASKAAKAQKNAANSANAVQLKQLAQQQTQYEQDRADLAPFREAGYKALGQIGTGTMPGGEFNRNFTMSDYEADPGYAFRLSEGNKALETSAAARGGVLSGGTLKALARYSQDTASQEYGAAYGRWNQNTTDRYNRLASIAGVGQTATNSGIAAGANNQAAQAAGAGAIGQNILGAGNARASQYVATGNAIGNLAGNIGQYYALKDLYKMPAGGGMTTPPYNPGYGSNYYSSPTISYT